jgi:putative MATE family efflux protein
MKDLTTGPVARHLLSMAAFIGAGLAFQAAYFLIDLYFVSGLGQAAIAGVSAASNTSFLIMAASQLVGVGVTSLIAQASGRRDMTDAQTVFNQAMSMSIFAFCLTLAAGWLLAGALMGGIAADAASKAAGTAYLHAFLPSLAATFPMTALVCALRGAGIVQAPMLVQTSSLALNAVLAPVLIAGWGTHLKLGAAGAGLASSIAGVAALIGLFIAFPRIQGELSLQAALLAPRLRTWWRIMRIGLPVAGEFGMMFLVTTIVYWATRHYGAAAQAGFGIGSRIMTSIFLPAMAVAFAVSPVAGQNMGARRYDRVRATVFQAGLMSSAMMLVLSVVCHWRPGIMIALFTADPAVRAAAAGFLSILSWNFVAVGLIFVCSGLFQAVGNTVPSFISSASRLITYGLPAVLMAGRPGVTLDMFWYLSVASTTLQALISLSFVRRELGARLGAPAVSA